MFGDGHCVYYFPLLSIFIVSYFLFVLFGINLNVLIESSSCVMCECIV